MGAGAEKMATERAGNEIKRNVSTKPVRRKLAERKREWEKRRMVEFLGEKNAGNSVFACTRGGRKWEKV